MYSKRNSDFDIISQSIIFDVFKLYQHMYVWSLLVIAVALRGFSSVTVCAHDETQS